MRPGAVARTVKRARTAFGLVTRWYFTSMRAPRKGFGCGLSSRGLRTEGVPMELIAGLRSREL